MAPRFLDYVDFLKRKLFRIFALLCDDNRQNSLQRSDLPVDVEHLRFQKRRAVKCNDGRRFGRRGQCLRSTSPPDDSARKADIKPHGKLKINREQLEPFPLSGVRVEKDIVLGATVNRGRFWI